VSSIGDRTSVTVCTENLFGVEVTVEFWVEYTINGVPQTTEPTTQRIPGSGQVTNRVPIEAPRENVSDVFVRTPDMNKSDCRIIYGEW